MEDGLLLPGMKVGVSPKFWAISPMVISGPSSLIPWEEKDDNVDVLPCELPLLLRPVAPRRWGWVRLKIRGMVDVVLIESKIRTCELRSLQRKLWSLQVDG